MQLQRALRIYCKTTGLLTRLAGVHVDIIGYFWCHMHVQQLLDAIFAVIGATIVQLRHMMQVRRVLPMDVLMIRMNGSCIFHVLFDELVVLVVLVVVIVVVVTLRLVNGNASQQWLLMQLGAFDMR